MSKMQGHPTDAMIAARLGELELRAIRMTWLFEQQNIQIQQMAQALAERDAQIAVKDAEITRLHLEANEPGLPLGSANGKHVEMKH